MAIIILTLFITIIMMNIIKTLTISIFQVSLLLYHPHDIIILIIKQLLSLST